MPSVVDEGIDGFATEVILTRLLEFTDEGFNTADVARQYNIKDIDGTVPLDFRRVINNSSESKGNIMMIFIDN